MSLKRKSGQNRPLMSLMGLSALLSISLTASQPASFADSPLQRGCNQMVMKKFNDAVSSFSEAISTNNSDSMAYFRRGQAFYILQNYKNAITDFDRAISFDQTIPSFFLWRGSAHAKNGEDPMDVLDYMKAMRLDPQLVTNFNDAGGKLKELPSSAAKDEGRTTLVSSKTGKTDSINLGYSERAVADFAEAAKRASPNTIAYIKPGAVFSGLTEVMQDGTKEEICPSTPSGEGSSAIKYGEMYYTLKNPKRDITIYDQELTSRPADPKLYYERGRAYQQMHDADKALADFNRAIDLDRDNAQYVLARCFLYKSQSKNDLVEADLKLAQDLDPSLPRTLKFGNAPEGNASTAKSQ